MNQKENFEKSKKDESNKEKEKIDFKLPFDMKTFWKSTDEKYFKPLQDTDINEPNHLIKLHSKYDIKSDHVFSKVGFPRTVNCFTGRPIEMFSKRNNPHYVTKLFGTYMYIDRYDYELNNLNNEYLNEEIGLIEERLNEIEQSNISYFVKLKESMLRERKALKLETSFDLRLDNITNQIYTLQMKQFAESISNIKKDVKKNKYVLLFDPSECMEPLTLDEEDYKDLMKHRDPMNSISVYDLFQEKTHMYYNTCTNKKRRGRNVTKKEESKIQIAKVISINYDFCHNCKQRKPAEAMVKCGSYSNSKFVEKPLRVLYVNNSTIVRKGKNFIITNFLGDPKDFCDGYFNKRLSYRCERFFCQMCLKGSYDQQIETVKDKKDWICPWCQGNCYCSRCLRYDQILKLIALYISLEGDINKLYDELVLKSITLDKLSINMLLSNVIILKNDPMKKQTTVSTQFNLAQAQKSTKEIEEILDKSYKYKDHLQEMKKYFDLQFNKAKLEKVLMNLDNKDSSKEENKEDFLLTKKRKIKENILNNGILLGMSLFENRSKQEEEKKDLPRKRGRPRKHFSNICENIPMKNRTKAYTSKRMKIKKLYSRMIKSLDI